MNNQLIQSLQRAAAYPHEVTAVHVIETHISWVFLTGKYAYKLKKPVDFGFLDFSTLAQRRHYCEEELRLNRRFAPELYLEVVTITGTPASPQINGTGAVLDVAVKMREFPQQSLWQHCMARGEINAGHIDQLARRVADFHRRADPAPENGASPPYGSFRAVKQPAVENIDLIRPLLTEIEQGRQLAQIEAWTLAQLNRLQPCIDKRRPDGFIRECHGDLHLGNIAFIDGDITLFDCIEFSDQLRWIDTQAELAFLLMDLEDKGCDAWANQLLNTYLEYTGDYDGLWLLPFYKVYRALVRAKVNILRCAQEDAAADERARALETYTHYTGLAQRYMQPLRPFLAITHGVSGSGKSTVASAVAAATGAIRIRSDVERKRLFGLQPDQDSRATAEVDIYTREATAKTFDRLAHLSCQLLEMGQPVIVDATFLNLEQRRRFKQLAEITRVPFAIIDCIAAEDTLVARLGERARLPGSVSEAGLDVMRDQQGTRTPLTGEERRVTITADTDRPLPLADIVARLLP